MTNRTVQFQFVTNNKPHHGLLCQNFFFHYYTSFVVKFAFVPESAVWQMVFTCCWANCKQLSGSFVVRSSFISSGFRGFSFWIWHNLSIKFNFLTFLIFLNV